MHRHLTYFEFQPTFAHKQSLKAISLFDKSIRHNSKQKPDPEYVSNVCLPVYPIYESHGHVKAAVRFRHRFA